MATEQTTVGTDVRASPADEFVRRNEPFLRWLYEWSEGLRPLSLGEEIAAQRLRPEEIALISEDMVRGFTHEGKLASPRIRAIIPNAVRLLQTAHDFGVRHFVLAQDTHSPNAPEFQAYPPHCIAGTAESEMIPEYGELPFAPRCFVVPKNSLSTAIGTPFEQWLGDHPELRVFLVIGNCTDLCVYTTAMHLRMWANAMNVERRVILPADCVQTYDLPVATARQLGILAHDADLLHPLFLYHLALNGVEVVREVQT